MHPSRSIPLVALAVLAACGSSDANPCNPASSSACSAGLTCEAVQGGSAQCFAPLFVQGSVFDLATPASKIAGARVVALDANRAPVSNVATTATDGGYEIQVPATRDAKGVPVAGTVVTLRADAKGYQGFPAGLRQPVPIDLGTAQLGSGKWVVSSSATAVGLSAIAGAGSASVHGTVQLAASGGVLVVVTPSGGGAAAGTAIADRSGAYAVFNLAPGSYEIEGYAAGVNYVRQAVTLPAGDTAVNLSIDGAAPAVDVSGTVQLVGQNQPSNPTSVVLVVDSTYDPALNRGEQPPGLRASDITSTYAIHGVPNGTYRVLGGFENDGWVYDRGGGSTPPLSITVAGAAVNVPGFKITGAVSLGAPFVAPYDVTPWVAASTTPTFSWAAYPSASSGYDAEVIDSAGTQVWSATLTGANQTSAQCTTALTPGAYYQFRVTAWSGTTLQSQSEDLKGVFFVP